MYVIRIVVEIKRYTLCDDSGKLVENFYVVNINLR